MNSIVPTDEALVSPMEARHLGVFEGIKHFEGDIGGKDDLTYSAGGNRWIGSGEA